MHHDVGSPLQWAHAVWRWDGVVDNQRHSDIVGDLGDTFDVEHVVLRIGEHFAVERLGVGSRR